MVCVRALVPLASLEQWNNMRIYPRGEDTCLSRQMCSTNSHLTLTSPREVHGKEEILCLADDHRKSRHHTSLFIRNCKLVSTIIVFIITIISSSNSMIIIFILVLIIFIIII